MSPRSDNNAMNQTNRGVTVSGCGAPSGEPVLAEVGAPFMLSLDVAGYCSVIRTRHPFEGPPSSPASAVRSSALCSERAAVGPWGVLVLASSGAAGERFW